VGEKTYPETQEIGQIKCEVFWPIDLQSELSYISLASTVGSMLHTSNTIVSKKTSVSRGRLILVAVNVEISVWVCSDVTTLRVSRGFIGGLREDFFIPAFKESFKLFRNIRDKDDLVS
jgi:hypothetical protein